MSSTIFNREANQPSIPPFDPGQQRLSLSLSLSLARALRLPSPLSHAHASTTKNKTKNAQTDGSEPNKLLVAEMTVFRARVAAADAVAASADGRTAMSSSSASALGSSSLHTTKAILHPGEVNKIREIVQNPAVVVTHTDDPRLFAWNTDRQPDRSGEGGPSAAASTPDLVLSGHADVAEFALATSSAAPFVASGGRDERVLVWSLADAEAISAVAATGASPSASSSPASKELKPRSTFVGHSAAVEDVCFRPGSSDLLASVGDDGALLLWDSRIGGAAAAGPGKEAGGGIRPAASVRAAHGPDAPDVQCVDWSRFEQGAGAPGQLATGAESGTVRAWDPRKLTTAGGEPAPLAELPSLSAAAAAAVRASRAAAKAAKAKARAEAAAAAAAAAGGGGDAAAEGAGGGDDDDDDDDDEDEDEDGGDGAAGAILRVEWSPTARGVLAAGGEDGIVALWDLTRARGLDPDSTEAGGSGGGARKEAEGEHRGANGGDGAPLPPPAAEGEAAAANGASAPPSSSSPSPFPRELFFQHAGHRSAVADFQWHPEDPFTLLSVSDDTEREHGGGAGGGDGGGGGDGDAGGGTVQAWRVSELVTLTVEEAVALLTPYEEYILKGKLDGPHVPGAQGAAAAAAAATAAAAAAEEPAAAAADAVPAAAGTATEPAAEAEAPAADAAEAVPAPMEEEEEKKEEEGEKKGGEEPVEPAAEKMDVEEEAAPAGAVPAAAPAGDVPAAAPAGAVPAAAPAGAVPAAAPAAAADDAAPAAADAPAGE